MSTALVPARRSYSLAPRCGRCGVILDPAVFDHADLSGPEREYARSPDPLAQLTFTFLRDRWHQLPPSEKPVLDAILVHAGMGSLDPAHYMH